ncbi:MAG: MBL fold metallo-hydrolase [Actinobacteria bacterium]|nr:MBL fold metallo-hydrolase [Actinomycetota bacterium]
MTEVRVISFLVSELRLPPGEQALLGREWWPSYAHAVVHRDGIFLFDNGVGFGNAEVEERFSPRVTPIGEALAEHGIALSDVTGIANCHLHFDHSGQNARLPKGVPIFVQRAEWAKVHDPDYTIAEWIDVPGLSYELLDGEAEVGPGLRLISTPGHTRGHQSLVIDSLEGSVVLAGQAVQSLAEWDGATGSAASGEPNAPDREAYARSVERLRSFDPIRVHFAHDAAVWERG